MQRKTTFYLGISGIIASILVGLGEFYLHYSPNVLSNPVDFAFFSKVSNSHLQMGHILVIIGIPFYFGGYLHIYQMLKNGSETWARLVLTLGFMAFTVGGVWISSRLMIGNIIHLQSELGDTAFQKLISIYKDNYEVLVQILRIVIALLSVAFAYTILKFKTHYPKWMAIFSPIVILIIFVVVGFLIPTLGKFILPILMNITHLILFGISLTIIRK